MIEMTNGEARPRNPERTQRIAAIDTSSDRAGVALFDGQTASVIAWNAHRTHTVDTLAQLDHLLRLSGVDLREIDGIAVATGPGSFSALRVGLSIAKGLSFSLNLPIAGVPTTDAIAAHMSWVERSVVAVMTAGRGRVVWSRYEAGAHVDGPRNTTVEELRIASVDAMVTGETELLSGFETVSLPAGARVEQVARLGWSRLQRGDVDDPVTLEPIYAHGRRSPEAVTA